MARTRWHAWFNVVLGVWLLTSPIVLGYSERDGFSGWNSFLLGAAVTGIALRRLSLEIRGQARVDLVLGVWIILSPAIFGFAGLHAVMWNHLGTGLLIVINALGETRLAARHA